MINLIGSIGAILLAICAVPLAYSSIKSGKSEISSAFLYIWTFGEIFSLTYLLLLGETVLIWNYVANLALLVVVIYYKWRPRDDKKRTN